MLSKADFSKKQILFVFATYGEKISFSNDNIVVKSKDGKIKLQCTCYRVFIVFVVGNCSITTVVLQRAKKFGIRIALLTPSFRLYSIVGAEKEGNYLLHERQYSYNNLEIAKQLVTNKITNQLNTINKIRGKTPFVNDSITKIKTYLVKLQECDTLNEIMAFEGLSSKVYFGCQFSSCDWSGRKPRLKPDIINSTMDVGYTILFAFVETILSCYGFDLYKGVLHRQFYMRKSLVCDLVEPFRCLIDSSIKKAYHLGQISPDDFILLNDQYQLKWEVSGKYVQFMLKSLLDNKEEIFDYFQKYYAAFMKNADISMYPMFLI